MQISSILTAAAVLAGPIVAQSVSIITTAPATTTTDLTTVVSELPSCAIGCLEESAKIVNCSAADLTCLCGKSVQFAAAIGPCVLTSACSSSDQNKLISIAEGICNDVSSSSPSQIAAASSYVAGVAASETATTSSDNLAAPTTPPVAGLGLMGAAVALAAMVL
ncbi:hypothetical protein M406DRAFT_333869 [Cryphonectria parasitica EP155]|uniref:CFEM domain-containing protein n=1 Tax=Cryphonectria parasitica (strain ATCC 38755 / EP155) TaxID=660469 RepID=A0A9P4XWF1_CRYP1|nr:uncharacterized protein M406DRAFT_333869 [Cryphonectria parasitica EP155]KAF3761820.1 hypothetical protein M406DRAFT_333869 [Cryphonectria parasitica EP155]